MDQKKRQMLEAAGYSFGDAEDFLELTEEERRLIELKVALSRLVRRNRVKRHLTQLQVAKRLNSSQSRVAKIEAASPDVSLDLMFRGLFAVGGKLSDLTDPSARPKSTRSQGTRSTAMRGRTPGPKRPAHGLSSKKSC